MVFKLNTQEERLKTLQEITAALEAEYNRDTYTLAPVKRLKDGNDYISWNDSADLANKLFGPMLWDSTVVSMQYREVDDGETVHRGYEAIVRITAKYLDENNVIQIAHRDGAGFGALVPQGRKNPLDLAYKAAESDAFSRAAKKFGDYFGLFLYDKPVEDDGAGYNRPTTSGSVAAPRAAAAGGGKGYPVSDGRKTHLAKNGYTPEQIEGMTNAQASAFFDRLWKDHMSVEDSAEAAGIPLPAAAPAEKKQQGSFPIPAGR